jgi:hypothetical protein
MPSDFPVSLAGIGGSEVVQAATGVLLDSFPNSTQTAFPPFPPVFIDGHNGSIHSLHICSPTQNVDLRLVYREITCRSSLGPERDTDVTGFLRLAKGGPRVQ